MTLTLRSLELPLEEVIEPLSIVEPRERIPQGRLFFVVLQEPL